MSLREKQADAASEPASPVDGYDSAQQAPDQLSCLNMEAAAAASSGPNMIDSWQTSAAQAAMNTFPDNLTPEEEEESILQLLQHTNPGEQLQGIQTRLESWKEVSIDIGVIGISGSGKSSFINAVRGLKPKDLGAAAVGVTQTTVKPTDYPHPKNPKIRFWDLPGLGASRFPKEEYLRRVKFHAYDFFVITSSTRFTEDDIWLASEIRRSGRDFYFARTRIDEDVKNHEDDFGFGNYDEESLLSDVRKYCESNLDCLPNVQVFLISNKFRMKFDFSKLEDQYLKNLPEFKREAALFSMVCTSSVSIEEKAKLLLRHSRDAVLKCCVAAAVPIPGFAYMFDMSVLRTEIEFYKQVFALDSPGLDLLSKSSGLPIDKFQLRVDCHEWSQCSDENVHSLLKVHAPEYFLKNIVSSVPIIGTVAGPLMAYKVAKKVLVGVIKSMRKEALDLVAMATERP